MAKANARKIEGVLDFETDPFLAGRIPYPFACGIYFAEHDYVALWEPSIINKTLDVLRSLPTCLLYAHNGGKFDFQYLVEYANPGEIQIRNGRITRMNIGKVELVDTWPLMPFPLAEYQKTKIDYRKFEKEKRRQHREEITRYMLDDCRDLLTLVTEFKKIVGEKDTIAAAAFHQMKLLDIEIQTMNESHDENFRRFFYGGRCQAFKKGIFKGRFQYYDINSAYPFAMTFNHPTGADYKLSNRLPKKLNGCFVHCIADSNGAFPLRNEDGSLDFPSVKDREFFVTGWEVDTAIKTKTAKIKKVIECWRPQNEITFKPYVEKFFPLKAKAKKDGDTIHYLAYKYLTNSGYGKFAQNPRDFRDYLLAPYGENVDGYEWETDFGALSLWSKPSYDGFGFYDVATAASITGYVRSMFWRSAVNAKLVLYGDTDSRLGKGHRDTLGHALGQWKIEDCPECHRSNIVTTALIGGKKLYAIEYACGHRVIRSKGARLEWSDMLDICNGKSVKWKSDAPTFSTVRGATFIERTITAT
jgi:DNA polymerase elongation subunit (family B)